MTSYCEWVWIRSSTSEYKPHQSPAGGAVLCGQTPTKELVKTPFLPEVTWDHSAGKMDLHVSHGGRDVLLHPLQILILEDQEAARSDTRPMASSLLTVHLGSPSLTTLFALAEPLVSFFIPLIFIPSADTNIWFQSKAASDSEETKE